MHFNFFNSNSQYNLDYLEMKAVIRVRDVSIQGDILHLLLFLLMLIALHVEVAVLMEMFFNFQMELAHHTALLRIGFYLDLTLCKLPALLHN